MRKGETTDKTSNLKPGQDHSPKMKPNITKKMQELAEAMRPYLRRRTRAKGEPGSLTCRIMIQTEGKRYKAHRVQIGLGTSDEEQAIYGAALLVRAFRLVGMNVTSRIS